jgi:hypothetical protein
MIPFQWQNGSAYYVTYFGDVYHGYAIEADFNSNDFYVISKNQWLEYNAQNAERFKAEAKEKYGIYIPSVEIIHKRIPDEQFQNPRDNTQAFHWQGSPSSYKKMYVFGAGASAFCQFKSGKNELLNHALRPPLGPDLFSARFSYYINRYPGLKLILPKFEARGNDIEAILEDDWADLMQRRDLELAAQHVQLQFFLQEIFKLISESVTENFYRHSLHTLFVQNILRKWDTENRPVFVSFNYDTILEDALEKQLRIKFDSIGKYVNQGEHSKLLFFKPHGSCNWGWEFNKTKVNIAPTHVAKMLYDNHYTPAQIYYELLGPGMLTTEGWGFEAANNARGIGRLTPNRNKIKVVEPGKVYFPALLLPYRDKDDFVMPYNMQIHMESSMCNIEELVLIGWKGSEDLFNNKLKKQAQRLQKITIVNPDVETVKKELGKYLELTKYEISEVKDFEDYVLNHMK